MTYTKEDKVLEYTEAKTALVTRITPELGTTAGGTKLVIEGENFFASQKETTVVIDGIPCVVSSVTPTMIICTTGPRPDFVESTFVVDFKKGGHAAT